MYPGLPGGLCSVLACTCHDQSWQLQTCLRAKATLALTQHAYVCIRGSRRNQALSIKRSSCGSQAKAQAPHLTQCHHQRTKHHRVWSLVGGGAQRQLQLHVARRRAAQMHAHGLVRGTTSGHHHARSACVRCRWIRRLHRRIKHPLARLLATCCGGAAGAQTPPAEPALRAQSRPLARAWALSACFQLRLCHPPAQKLGERSRRNSCRSGLDEHLLCGAIVGPVRALA